jgi:Cu2+-exporting ATPase
LLLSALSVKLFGSRLIQAQISHNADFTAILHAAKHAQGDPSMLIFPALVIGGAMAAVAALSRRGPTPLIDRLAAPQAAVFDQPPATQNRLVAWDEAYQAWVQARLDPVLAMGLRDQSMRELVESGRHLGKLEKDLNRSLAAAIAVMGLLGAEALTGLSATPLVLAFGVYTAWPSLKEVYRITLKERRLSILHLMTAYALAQWLSGSYWAGVSGILVTVLGAKAQLLTRIATRHSLSHLFGEWPVQVWVVVGEVEMQIPRAALKVGDLLVLEAGQPVPVDGVVVHGAALLDQQRLTGEPQALEKKVGDTLLAGTILLEGRLRLRVEKTGRETAAARIGEILNRAVERQELRLADYYKDIEHTLLPMLGAASVGALFKYPRTGVALFGCNFLVGTVSLRLMPLLKAMRSAAERGIWVKDGQALQSLDTVDSFVFDKTACLALERQQVAQVFAAVGHDKCLSINNLYKFHVDGRMV